MTSWYDTAQVCINGHAINDSFKQHPTLNQDFCDKCGAKTITQCESCNPPIKGLYNVPGVAAIGFEYPPPKFCHNCGKPYPWTKSSLKAAKELAGEIENLNDEEKRILKQSLDELVKDSPNTQVAALRFKRLMSKTGKSSADALKDILVNILSESAKKLIWG